MKLNDYVSLLRPGQYYKNLVVFLALYFSGNLLNSRLLAYAAAAFVLLCMLSSANYIINDAADRKRDRYNREKAGRPLASGRVTVFEALLIAALLLAVSLGAAYVINMHFFITMLALFLLTTLYSLALKHELFLDIIAISSNFVLRALAGAAIIGVWASPWLLIGTFFLTLFLSAGKRKSEKAFLKAKAGSHRPLLEKYSEQNLMFLLQMSATVLLVSYALYSFLGTNRLQVVTLPIALYIMLRYLYLAEAGAPETRHAGKLLADARIVAGALLYGATSFFILYVAAKN